MTSRENIQKELAKKLVWAVNSTLGTPENAKQRVRAWGWRLSGKMLDAKQPSALTSTRSSRYAGMAGGGVDEVSDASSTSPLSPGGRNIDGISSATRSEPGTPVRGPNRPDCRWLHPAPARCSYSDCWWSGVGSFRSPAGVDDGWGRWDWINSAPTPEESLDRRRYANSLDDSVRGLQKGCRELHIAAYKTMKEMGPWQPRRSTTSGTGTPGRYVNEWPSRATEDAG